MSNIMGGPQPAPDNDRLSLATIDAALEAGVTFLNTGVFYSMDHHETIVARAIAHCR